MTIDHILESVEAYNQASFEGDSEGMRKNAHAMPYINAMEAYSQASFEYNYQKMAENSWILPIVEAKMAKGNGI